MTSDPFVIHTGAIRRQNCDACDSVTGHAADGEAHATTFENPLWRSAKSNDDSRPSPTGMLCINVRRRNLLLCLRPIQIMRPIYR